MSDPLTLLLVLTRLTAMLAVFPVLSAPVFPARVRIGLGALASFLIAPTVPPVSLGHLGLLSLMGVLMTETLIGLLLGFVARMVFFAVEIAGAMISTEIGLSLAPSFNPLNSGRTDVPSILLFYLAGVLLLSLDVHHWMLAGFHRTYALVPVGGAHLPEALLVHVIGRSGQVFTTALQMTAPLMASSFIVSLIFTVLSRAVPQMNVFGESFALRTLAGIAVFGLTIQLMAQHIVSWLERLPEDVLRVAQFLGAA
jgi:flagellar biosynthetic protein FliR